ncbi:MAG: FIST C-terminal domain-containing protein [Peptococcaceae bacterium]|nr:FIST C-terminal domain-containing protein [Peptococcaceae bacterium]
MIRMFTAYTEEIDEAEIAVSELLEQLNLDSRLLRNSVGIVHCFSDFLEGGLLQSLNEALPFDLVGCTTLSVSAPDFMSQMGLTLTVLTSDDIQFVTGVSDPIDGDMSGPVTALYERLISGLPQKPAMLTPFIPFMLTIGGDEFIEKIDALSGGIPAFGTLAISNEPDYSKIYTIYNGDYYDTSLVLLAFIGDVEPVFFSASVDDANILKQKAVVTSAKRNILETVNNVPTVDYLESIGLAKDGDSSGLVSMPLIVSLEDGSKLIRACIAFTEERGAILCGAIPVNSILALSTMGIDDVVQSTAEKIGEAVDAAGGKNVLIYSCAGRRWALGINGMAEHEAVTERTKDALPYCFAYSGGEIFPERFADGRIVNHLQNDSIIICVL